MPAVLWPCPAGPLCAVAPLHAALRRAAPACPATPPPALPRLARAPQVELQGVSLVVLSFFRDEAAATALADLVAAHGGILGAAVCCAEKGGDPSDDWTTCEADRDELLDRWAPACSAGL